MTGIGGVRMWMEDFLINASTYSKEYRRDFLKVKNLWNNCVADFKSAKSIGKCNSLYDEYLNKLDDLRDELYASWGRNRLPIGIADTLDYFEEAIGDLDDNFIIKLIEKGGRFTTMLPLEYPKDIIVECKNDYQRFHYELDFTIRGNKIEVSGDFYDVRSFLEEEVDSKGLEKAIDEGVFENA